MKPCKLLIYFRQHEKIFHYQHPSADEPLSHVRQTPPWQIAGLLLWGCSALVQDCGFRHKSVSSLMPVLTTFLLSVRSTPWLQPQVLNTRIHIHILVTRGRCHIWCVWPMGIWGISSEGMWHIRKENREWAYCQKLLPINLIFFFFLIFVVY